VRTTRMTNGSTNGSVAGDLVKGAVAGAVGTLALDAVTWFMWDREDPSALRQERQARPKGLDPAHFVANKVANAFGTKLKPEQPHLAGIATHFAIGVMPATL
jgi:hypothetical protein